MWWGAEGLGDGSPPVGSRGKAPVGDLGMVPQKLKQIVKLVYIFNVFLYNILDLMNIRAGLGEYILQTHNTNFFED